MVLQVVVKDGRVLIGELLCIDKQANIILGNTYQQVQRYDSQRVSASHSRCVSMCSSEVQVICMGILISISSTMLEVLNNSPPRCACLEYSSMLCSDSAPFKERPIGQVLVPASQRKSCHVEVRMQRKVVSRLHFYSQTSTQQTLA